ncbi:asparagine synthetase domain-containing protein CG17486 [Anopheles nili]|uniref:asparagine synthetase domain-containing protein CG17486 n=1 Tax=Anopheles nili TaxID=185578 RepID=UPI00237A8A5D|nr:asparagine synthetase domain-containing protein CG17486 [Anopheles nili]
MCGIFCYICSDDNISAADQALQSCQALLANRGPNHSVRLWYDSKVLFHGSVLWHQGKTLCKQPIETDQTVLLFNGDIFENRENTTQSDTFWLLQRIESCETQDDLHRLFANLRGPFSVIFFRKQENRIYFARDRVGRNSLILGRAQNGSGNTFISSVCGNIAYEFVHELPPLGLYYIDLDCAADPAPFRLLPWTESDCSHMEQLFASVVKIEPSISLEDTLPESVEQHNFDFHTLLAKSTLDENVFEYLCNFPEVNKICNRLIAILRESIRERIQTTTMSCKECLETNFQCDHPKIGILFSGGIDCTILALIADDIIPTQTPIDLMNVAFEKVNRSGEKCEPSKIDYNVPDRLTGRATVQELISLRPNRKWNFIEINVSRSELSEHRKTISDLVFPLQNVLDESLGAALWFASKGIGLKNGQSFTSTSRVLLLGSGADELFGGYTRHKAAFEKCLRSNDKPLPGEAKTLEDTQFQQAFQALQDELEADWSRLPSRNLARDDRVISDNGVTPRTPYLQEDFISLVRSLKASQRCYPPLGPGLGDKLVLRLCAYKLGLVQASCLRKRALQFGSRIADRKQNASDRSSYLQGVRD